MEARIVTTNPKNLKYRIYDFESNTTVANGIPSAKRADEQLLLLRLDMPSAELEIEVYYEEANS